MISCTTYLAILFGCHPAALVLAEACKRVGVTEITSDKKEINILIMHNNKITASRK